MANELFDTVYQNVLQKLESDELNARELLRDATLAEAVGGLCGLRSASYGGGDTPGIADRAWACLEPGAFALTDTGAFSFELARGLGICRDNSGSWATEGRGAYRWLYLESDETFSVNPVGTLGWTRYDIVLIRPTLRLAETASVPIKDPTTNTYSGVNSPTRYRQTLRWGTYVQFLAGDCDACVKEGTEALAPVEPTTDAGAIKVWTLLSGTASSRPYADWRRSPRLPASRLCLYVDGTTAGAFNPATDVTVLAEDGIEGYGNIVSRPLAGRFVIAWVGTPTTRPSIKVTPYGTGPGGPSNVIVATVVDIGGSPSFPQRGAFPAGASSVYNIVTINFYDIIGTAQADVAFEVEIIGNDYDGGFRS